MGRAKLIGDSSSSEIGIVSFQSVFTKLRNEAGIEDSPGLVADVCRVGRSQDPYIEAIELVWEQNRRMPSVEAALRDLVPKAVIEYAEANNTSLITKDALMGDIAVASESMTARQIVTALSCRELVLRRVLSGQMIG